MTHRRLRRSRRRGTRAFTRLHIYTLISGFVFSDAPYGDGAARRNLRLTDENRERMKGDWKRHQKRVVEVHRAERIRDGQDPISRPWAWWEFEAPEHRKIVKESQTLAPIWDEDRDYNGHSRVSFGMARGYQRIPGALDSPRDERPTYETEREYLIRLNLLTPEEKAIIANEGGQIYQA